MRRRKGLVPAIASLALVTAIAVGGLLSTQAAIHTAQRVHADDRARLQMTLAGLGDQYVALTFLQESEFALSGHWNLRPGDPADTQRLRSFVTTSPVQGYGAAIVDLQLQPLVTYAPATGLPPAGNPGFGPLKIALLAGKPGLSAVMHAGDIPVAAFAVPIMQGGKPVALLEAFSRLDEGPLEQYVQQLRYGKTGVGAVVDSQGVYVAAVDPRDVGKPAPSSPALDGLSSGGSGFVRYRGPDDHDVVAAYSAMHYGGWGGLTVQSAGEFYGPINRSGLRVEIALGILMIAAIALVTAFNERRRAALSREVRSVTALWEARERFRHAFDETPVGMALVRVDPSDRGRFLQVNRSLARLTGYDEAVLQTFRFQQIVHPDDAGAHAAQFDAVLAGEVASYELELRLVRADEHVLWVLLHGSVVRDTDGQALYAVAQLQDVTERKEAQDTLAHLALHDALTGLPNRVLFMDRLRVALAGSVRSGAHVAVLYLDLDRFKAVNDNLGHDAGDHVLMAVAERLRDELRPADTAARLGGDEFVIVCADPGGANGALALAERIEDAIKRPVEVNGQWVSVTASIGITVGGGVDAYAEALLRDADAAMYGAKQRGKARAELAPTASSTLTG